GESGPPAAGRLAEDDPEEGDRRTDGKQRLAHARGAGPDAEGVAGPVGLPAERESTAAVIGFGRLDLGSCSDKIRSAAGGSRGQATADLAQASSQTRRHQA